jgi:hypothetical protein
MPRPGDAAINCCALLPRFELYGTRGGDQLCLTVHPVTAKQTIAIKQHRIAATHLDCPLDGRWVEPAHRPIDEKPSHFVGCAAAGHEVESKIVKIMNILGALIEPLQLRCFAPQIRGAPLAP